MSINSLKSSRLTFRVWAEDDIAYAMKLWGNAEVSLHLGGPFKLKRVCKILLQEIKREKRTKVQIWPVFHEGQFIGACGLKRHWYKNGKYQMFILFPRESWRYGFAREAAENIAVYAFETLAAKKISIVNDLYNAYFDSLVKQMNFEFSHKCYDGSSGALNAVYVLTSEKYKSDKK